VYKSACTKELVRSLISPHIVQYTIVGFNSKMLLINSLKIVFYFQSQFFYNVNELSCSNHFISLNFDMDIK
jgi:hypothetical protein